jgi:pimeloyl-ACP methyl ester carboxylesterase
MPLLAKNSSSKTYGRKTSFLLLIGFSLVVLIIINIEAFAKPYENSTSTAQTIRFNTSQASDDSAALHYAYSGDIEKPGLIFIHGTPGGWGAFEVYLENPILKKDFFMVSVDRLGWGQSPLDPKQINGDFGPQAKSIKAVMDQYPKKKWTVIGHSLGASIAPKVAIIAPKQTSSLLLLSGSLKPKLGSPRWYNRVASTWVVSRMIGKSMRYSNREIMGLRKQLKKLDTEIKANKLDVDLIIMQGKKDRLVSPKNPSYANSAWKNNFKSISLIELENEGHFTPWNQTPLIIKTLIELNQ